MYHFTANFTMNSQSLDRGVNSSGINSMWELNRPDFRYTAAII